jgi:hypothetical protein
LLPSVWPPSFCRIVGKKQHSGNDLLRQIKALTASAILKPAGQPVENLGEIYELAVNFWVNIRFFIASL